MAKTMKHAFRAALSTMKNLCKHQTTHQEPKGKGKDCDKAYTFPPGGMPEEICGNDAERHPSGKTN